MHFALRSLNGQRCATRPKSEKNQRFTDTTKSFFFIGAFQYTSVSVGKGVRPLFIFFFGLVFFVFFLKKKVRTVVFALFWAFGKKGGFRWWEFENTGTFFFAGPGWLL
jgi:hypothetical protein